MFLISIYSIEYLTEPSVLQLPCLCAEHCKVSGDSSSQAGDMAIDGGDQMFSDQSPQVLKATKPKSRSCAGAQAKVGRYSQSVLNQLELCTEAFFEIERKFEILLCFSNLYYDAIMSINCNMVMFHRITYNIRTISTRYHKHRFISIIYWEKLSQISEYIVLKSHTSNAY